MAQEYPHYTDHSDILNAIETGDVQTAKQALVEHLEAARLSVHEQLKQKKRASS